MNNTEIIEAALKLSQADRARLLHKLQQQQTESATLAPAAGRDAFCEFYLEKFSTGYYWVAKDYIALRQLLNKIKKKLTEQKQDYSDQLLIDSYKHYLKAVYALNNEFYNANFTMSILNSKFNEIYIAISGKKQGKISNDYKSRILRDLQS